MDLRDIMDDTFDLYKENFVLLTTITAIVFLPLNLVMAFISAPPFNLTPGQTPPLSVMGPYIITLMSVGLLSIIATYIVTGALTKGVSERYLGHRITAREAYEAITRRFGAFVFTLILPFILLALITTVIIALAVAITIGLSFVHPIFGGVAGFLAFVTVFVLLVLMGFGISFVMPVFVVEQRTGWDAIKRSFNLFKFSPLKVIGTLLLALVILVIIEGMVTAPLVGLLQAGSALGNPLRPVFLSIQGAVRGIVQSIFQPIQIAIILLLYYDIRIRKEGFDLEVMANDLQSSVGVAGFTEDPGPSLGEGEPPAPVP
jgi:hypothetical protein